MKESGFRDQVRKNVEGDKGVMIKLAGGMRQVRGLPDCFVTSPYWRGFLELKVDKNRPDARQIVQLCKLMKYRTRAYVLHLQNLNDGYRVSVRMYNTDSTFEELSARAVDKVSNLSLWSMLREADAVAATKYSWLHKDPSPVLI